jgi:hypothetical protein
MQSFREFLSSPMRRSAMEKPRLEVDIYQIMDDSMLMKHRTDGTGWEWCWADWQREWMDATPNRYAYRCLPLTIANQTGWWIKNPVGFTAIWRGRTEPGSIEFRFDTAADTWSSWINSQFGEGIITWNTPFLFRTRPEGSRLFICGPINHFKAYAHPLSAIIESDWISMSFTMNYKIMVPGQPVRFEVGDPLFQAIPLVSNLCADLEKADVSFQKLSDDPEMSRAYQVWHEGRRQFHEQKNRGQVRPDDWQKDYFQGRDALGQTSATVHMTKIKPPRIRPMGGVKDAASAGARASLRLVEEPASPVAETPDAANGRAVSASVMSEVGGPSLMTSQSTVNRGEPADVATELSMGDPTQTSPPQGGQNGSSPTQATQISESTPSQVDDEWRRWIAENLMLDARPDNLVDTMAARGISRQEADREVRQALNSPYLRGSELVRNRLRKRNWLLATYRKLNRLHPLSSEVDRRHKLRRDDFLCNYYSTNRPVIITGMMDDWPAMKKWTLDYFAERFGDREIEIQMGRNAGTNYEIEREKYITRIRFSEFVSKLRTAGGTNDFYLTANNNSSNKSVLPELWEDIVQVPEYLDPSDRMAGFFWMGPAGTITPFHHDLTNNFMAQVMGRKRVRIAPSWDIPLMNNYFHCYSGIDGRVTPPTPHPALDEPQIIECILNPGEILFLPIGCLHFVEGVDTTITVSFTNFAFDNDFSSFYTTYHKV